jgi:hypothetical protein
MVENKILLDRRTLVNGKTTVLNLDNYIELYTKEGVDETVGNGGSALYILGTGGIYSTLRGDSGNVASSKFSLVSGGEGNYATAGYSSVTNGFNNQATGSYSFIGNGTNNITTGEYSFIGGGYNNTATSIIDKGIWRPSVIVGGRDNISNGGCSFVGAGRDNTASGYYSAISGGRDNIASGEYSTAIGRASTASGDRSTAIGSSSVASGEYSTVIGNNCQAPSHGEVVVGVNSEIYVPNSTEFFDAGDKIFSIGNGAASGSLSNAVTVLKNGKVGIGVPAFETTTDANPLQVAGGITATLPEFANDTAAAALPSGSFYFTTATVATADIAIGDRILKVKA